MEDDGFTLVTRKSKHSFRARHDTKPVTKPSSQLVNNDVPLCSSMGSGESGLPALQELQQLLEKSRRLVQQRFMEESIATILHHQSVKECIDTSSSKYEGQSAIENISGKPEDQSTSRISACTASNHNHALAEHTQEENQAAPSKFLRMVTKLVCLGIGSVTRSRNAMHQLACALVIRLRLYSNILWANWNVGLLSNMCVIGNSFLGYDARTIGSDQRSDNTNCVFSLLQLGVVSELPFIAGAQLPIDDRATQEEIDRAFSDTRCDRVMYFPLEDLIREQSSFKETCRPPESHEVIEC